MVNVSFDPEAGTLYWYFTEIEEGSTELEGECEGTLLLEANGDVIGLELELDESMKRSELVLALAHPHVRYDRNTATLTVQVAEEEPAEVQPLHEAVILDFDASERLQGCDVLAAREFELGKRLARLQPFMIELEEAPPPGAVFRTAPAASADEDADDASVDDDLLAAEASEDGALEAEELADAARLDTAEKDTAPEPGMSIAAQALAEAAEQALAEAEIDLDAPPSAPASMPAFAAPASFHTGFVALVGKPNVGKSTLLNALLGQKIAIVSPKPQTTRMPMRGMLNLPTAQIIFVDTPGIHDPRTKLGTFMVEQARRSIPDADVVCFVVDIASPPNRTEQRIAALIARSRAKRILVLNKLDQRTRAGQEHLEAYRALGPWDMEVAVSALLSKGLETLLAEIIARLPLGPALYPTDQLTDQSEREQAAELVREQVLRLTEQEVPHGVAVEVEEWEEKENATYIRMTIYVEKESQKGILIGANGAMLKRIGTGARAEIEAAIGRKAYLDLWVKARPNWRDDPSSLRWLGYRSDD